MTCAHVQMNYLLALNGLPKEQPMLAEQMKTCRFSLDAGEKLNARIQIRRGTELRGVNFMSSERGNFAPLLASVKASVPAFGFNLEVKALLPDLFMKNQAASAGWKFQSTQDDFFLEFTSDAATERVDLTFLVALGIP